MLLGDDLGFSSSTLVSPDVLRRHILPYYKRIAKVTHEAGKVLVFHSCGNMNKLMDELIDDVGIDAKHSYEDKVFRRPLGVSASVAVVRGRGERTRAASK